MGGYIYIYIYIYIWPFQQYSRATDSSFQTVRELKTRGGKETAAQKRQANNKTKQKLHINKQRQRLGTDKGRKH